MAASGGSIKTSAAGGSFGTRDASTSATKDSSIAVLLHSLEAAVFGSMQLMQRKVREWTKLPDVFGSVPRQAWR